MDTKDRILWHNLAISNDFIFTKVMRDENRIYNIEIQVANKKDLPKRSRYYQGMIDLNAIEKGELYNELKDSVIIFICKFDPFGDGLPRYTFKNICEENK